MASERLATSLREEVWLSLQAHHQRHERGRAYKSGRTLRARNLASLRSLTRTMRRGRCKGTIEPGAADPRAGRWGFSSSCNDTSEAVVRSRIAREAQFCYEGRTYVFGEAGAAKRIEIPEERTRKDRVCSPTSGVAVKAEKEGRLLDLLLGLPSSHLVRALQRGQRHWWQRTRRSDGPRYGWSRRGSCQARLL